MHHIRNKIFLLS